MKKHLEIILMGLLLSFGVFCKVRTVRTNDRQMAEIRLKMGKSTLLSFSEEPQKIVMGNPDFFMVEFVENDLTLNPKGIIETNLFVYTKERIFAFLLQVVQSGEYDDLVHVKWKSRFRYRLEKKTSKVKEKQSLKFDLEKFEFVEERKILLIDFSLKNLTDKKVNLQKLAMKVFQEKQELKTVSFVLSTNNLNKNKKAKGKIIARFFKKGKIHFKAKLKNKEYHLDVNPNSLSKIKNKI